MHSQHLTEDKGDKAVKQKLWETTERELMTYAADYAEAHERGTRKTEKQKDIAATARARGYPKLMVYAFAAFIRRDLLESDEATYLTNYYRQKLGI